jgi:hypothetical protein
MGLNDAMTALLANRSGEPSPVQYRLAKENLARAARFFSEMSRGREGKAFWQVASVAAMAFVLLAASSQRQVGSPLGAAGEKKA